MEDTTFTDINLLYFSSFIFKVNRVLNEEVDNLSEKIIIVEKELDSIDIDDIALET